MLQSIVLNLPMITTFIESITWSFTIRHVIVTIPFNKIKRLFGYKICPFYTNKITFIFINSI